MASEIAAPYDCREMTNLVKPPHSDPEADPVAAVDVFGSTLADILRGAGNADALAVLSVAELALEPTNEEMDEEGNRPLRLRLRIQPRAYGAINDRQRAHISNAIHSAARAIISETSEGHYLASVLITPAMSRDPTWRAQSQAFLEELAQARRDEEIPF